MMTVALTGGIGCGKSLVCQFFAQLNVPVIDTDIIAHDLVKPDQLALQEITAFFGTDILLNDGSLDRKALANITFNNKNQRKHLESILHPKIRQLVKKKIELLTTDYAIIAIPLLIETSQQSEYDRVLVVDCDEQQQIQRTLSRDQRSLEEIKAIMNSQVSRQERLKYANDIIDNSQDKNSLQSQVKKLDEKYRLLAHNTNL